MSQSYVGAISISSIFLNEENFTTIALGLALELAEADGLPIVCLLKFLDCETVFWLQGIKIYKLFLSGVSVLQRQLQCALYTNV